MRKFFISGIAIVVLFIGWCSPTRIQAEGTATPTLTPSGCPNRISNSFLTGWFSLYVQDSEPNYIRTSLDGAYINVPANAADGGRCFSDTNLETFMNVYQTKLLNARKPQPTPEVKVITTYVCFGKEDVDAYVSQAKAGLAQVNNSLVYAWPVLTDGKATKVVIDPYSGYVAYDGAYCIAPKDIIRFNKAIPVTTLRTEDKQ
jgi:hypothetical protein